MTFTPLNRGQFAKVLEGLAEANEGDRLSDVERGLIFGQLDSLIDQFNSIKNSGLRIVLLGSLPDEISH